MKLKQILLPLFASLALSSFSLVAENKPAEGHAHEPHEKIKAPNGGRVLTTIEPHAEFFLTADRKVQITFLDDAGKAIAPADQVVTVFTGERAAPTKLSFKKAGNVLISDGAVPAGDGFATVVQIKAAPDAKTVTEKFNLDLSTCSGCNLKEYACTCGH